MLGAPARRKCLGFWGKFSFTQHQGLMVHLEWMYGLMWMVLLEMGVSDADLKLVDEDHRVGRLTQSFVTVLVTHGRSACV